MPKLKLILKYVLGVAFIVAGINHFLRPTLYLRMMPDYLPAHRLLVDLSGVAESVLGVLLLVPRFTRLAAWGLILLLIAVFPANVNMALNPALFPEVPPLAAWVRLPLQLVLIAWASWYTRPMPKVQPAHHT